MTGAAGGVAALVALASVAPHASWSKLPTSNGFAAAVYDVAHARVTSLREHLYARRDAATPTRELMYDFYFGLRAGGANAWLGESPVDAAGWDDDVDGAGVVRVVQHQGDLRATQYFFAPFQVDAPALVAVVSVTNTGAAPAADAALFALANLHVGGGAGGTQGESIVWTNGAFEERGEGARLVLLRALGAPPWHHATTPVNPYLLVKNGARLVDADASGVVDDAVSGLEWDLGGLAPGETRTFGLVLAVAPDGDRAALDAALAPLLAQQALAVLATERAGWKAFFARAVQPEGLSADERAVYRRQLAVLRMAQVREPNAADARPYGQIVASPPPGGWNVTWVRDQAYAVRALVRARLHAEARAALAFVLGGSAGEYEAYVGAPYALSVVRYHGNGHEESDWNADGPNVELDGFGLTLGALDEYVTASGDESLLAQHAEAIFARTADVLVHLLEPATGLIAADSSIWESHWDHGARQHYAYTQATAAWGLRAAAHLATRRGDAAAAATYAASAAALATSLAARLVDPANHVLRGSLEQVDHYLDAATVEAFNLDVLPADGKAALATLDALRTSLWLGLTGHGYRRNDDGGAYDEREWIVMDLRIALAARRAGRATHAAELIAWVTAQARANRDLIPENFHPFTADYAGEVPMAGFGAGAYVLALFERADATPPPPPPPPPPASPDAGLPSPPPGASGCTAAPAPGTVLPNLLSFVSLGVFVAFRRRRKHPKVNLATPSPWVAVLLVLGGCGIEGLFGGGGYHATERPRVTMAFVAPAGASVVEAWDTGEKRIGAAAAGEGILDLGDERDQANVRLVARDEAGRVVGRATVAQAARAAEPHDVGTIDANATAAAILVEGRVEYEGLQLGATPPPIVAAIVAQAAGDDAALVAFRELTVQLVADGAIAALGAGLEPAWVAQHATEAAAYDVALAAAVARVGVPIVCDPALVRVMFTVDVSGQALDGNGARQFIRQPPKQGRVFLGLTVDESSAVTDAAGLLPGKLTPNDPGHAMTDDGTGGDELAGDGVFTLVTALPRGMRIKYKYTDGSAGEGFTRTEEWPGNARILQLDDVLTRRNDGQPDCLIVRRDSFGDEASNKNFTSLAAPLRAQGGALGWDVDLGGAPGVPLGAGTFVGGLALGDLRGQPPLTPAGVPEARENGVCTRCPAPLTLALDDDVPPQLISAAFRSTTEIEVRFSETMDPLAAADASAWLVVDASLRALPVRAVMPLGDRVRLTVEAPDFGARYTLHVAALPDASARHNLLDGETTTPVGADVTPPRALVAVPGSRKDLDAAATLADATLGELVTIAFSEELDPAIAEDVGHYRITTITGEPLRVRAAFVRQRTQVVLLTDAQQKRLPYRVRVVGVADFAGNFAAAAEPLAFAGFALYRLRVGVVPGHAFASRDGARRGLPRDERLYLTGTPLAVARVPGDGTSLAIPGRTDVTGVPEFEMLPGAETHAGKPIYWIELLVPPGVYAWKAAHGVPGEWTHPPATLEKVSKSLGTSNDATGVNVDPVTLIARNGIDYAGARLSMQGSEAPAPGVLYKRENPDEICVVEDADVACPTIVVGTWRDVEPGIADYDDGQPEVPPVRLVADRLPPALLALGVRDSESLRLSFDEKLPAGATLTLSAQTASGAGAGTPLAIVESTPGFPAPHELVVRTAPQALATTYTLTIAGLVDDLGNGAGAPPRSFSWTSPSAFAPFQPFDDHQPPALLAATPESPTRVRVQFSEKLAADAASVTHFSIAARGTDAAPAILAATLAGNGKDILLTTSTQPLQGQFALAASGIADVASPANVLAGAHVDFVGFGDSVPPVLGYARAISTGAIVLAFDEALDAASSMSAASYSVAGATVTGVEFAGDPALATSPFDPGDAPRVRHVVLLHTSPLAAGQAYAVTTRVRDLSGNQAAASVTTVTGVAAPVTVDVVLEVRVSASETVAGATPARALSPARLAAEREGIFVVGVGGFPPEGSPLAGAEPRLHDDGQGGDAAAADGVYSLTIPGVALGSTLAWKAFAPYTVAWKNAHPGDASAAFADATPGPAAFSDGQEFPGNENGVRVLGDPDGDGRVHGRALFGDETTYKKLTMTPAFVWLVGDFSYAP